MIAEFLASATRAWRGPAPARAAQRRALATRPDAQSGVSQLEQSCASSTDPNDDAPIFLLSAGWRSGSTLLQRLIMSDPSVLLWGEPYDECGLTQAMADSLRAFRSDWPPAEYFYDGTQPDRLTGSWIANLFPATADLRAAHRALFDALYAGPARRAGVRRWGIKEVRLTGAHCHYLKWLYPRARFVFLYRNPFDAYRSYCGYGSSWYDIYPDRPILTPAAFGTHWRRLTQDFLAEAKPLGALLIRYEDVVGGAFDYGVLEQHLAIRVRRDILEKKIGGFSEREAKVRPGWPERWVLRRATAPVARQLGYSW